MIKYPVHISLCIFFLLFTRYLIIKSALLPDDCGEGPPVGNCAQDCYRDCVTRLPPITDPFVKEQVIMEKNICILRCKALVYKPQMNYAAKRRPYYSDVANCLDPCQYPMTDDCRTGYLSMFFYCDCYQCCALKSPANAEMCIAGCHEWYEKKWSSTGTDICHFQPEYAKTPIHWCQAFCIWKILRLFHQNASHIPEIRSDKAIPCTTKCVAILHNDIPVDYDTIFPRCRDNEFKCVTSATIHDFDLSKADMSTAAFHAAIDPLNLTLFKDDYNNTSDATEKRISTKSFILYPNYTTTLPEGINNMRAQGVKIKVAADAHTKVTMPPPTLLDDWIDESDVGQALAEAFKPGGVSKFTGLTSGTIDYHKEVDVDGCTNIKTTMTAKLAIIEVDFNVSVTISDTEGIVPMDAGYLKTAVAWKADWRGGMTYVDSPNDYSIKMVGTGRLKVEVVLVGGHGVACELLLPANCNSTTRNDQLPCRCNGVAC